MIARYFQGFILHVSLVTEIFRNFSSMRTSRVPHRCRQLRQGNKAELVRCLQGTTDIPAESPQVDVKVFDGAVVVQMLHPKTAWTFKEYVQIVFLPYVNAQLQSAVRLDIVWDTYKEDSLKKGAREKRGSGARRRVAPTVNIPPNWKSFLRVDDNKTELFRLLAEEVVSIAAPGKEVYSTQGNQVVSNGSRQTMEGLQPCSHEEADTRIFLHVVDAAQQHQRIMIRTIDTDVFVLAVSQMQRMPHNEVWLVLAQGSVLSINPRNRPFTWSTEELGFASLPRLHRLWYGFVLCY